MKQNGIVELHISEPLAQIDAKVKRHKKHFRRHLIKSILVILMMIFGTYWVFMVQTFSRIETTADYGNESAENTKYKKISNGFLKYGRDGISLLDAQGKEVWNQPYQIKNPIVEICDKTAVVGDSSGTQILVLDENGLKGEIKTDLPIEKLSVSGQGIVAALLVDETAPKVICYDAAGNVLVEHPTSMKKRGYPMDVSISTDGYMLAVTYLSLQDNGYSTKVGFYNFNQAGQNVLDNQVALEDFKDTIMPTAFFMSETVSAVIGDQSIQIYKGRQIPKLSKEMKLDKEIKSVSHTDKYIALVLKGKGKGYELRIYNTNGMKVMSKEFEGEYSNMQMYGKEVIMFEGAKCNIYTVDGVNKFNGELDAGIGNIIPVFGMNKYVMMNANGMQEIRLVR